MIPKCVTWGCFIGTLLAPVFCHAWGAAGHKIVAAIAYEMLTPETRAEVDKLLDEDFIDASLWADDIKEDRPETAPWHYVNTPRGETAVELKRDCADGNCVVAQIQRNLQTLRDTSNSRETRREALKFVIHFIADIHQPLHVSRAADRGGNDIAVAFFGEPTNLHAVWDKGLLEKFLEDNGLTWRSHARDLSQSPYVHEIFEPGEHAAVHWANTSRSVAEHIAYAHPDGRPVKSGDRLGAAYYRRTSPVVNESLRIAGVRLAHAIGNALADEPSDNVRN